MILFFVPAILSPHYSIEYRKHFTNIHVTVVGIFGATEELMIHIIVYLIGYFYGGDMIFQEIAFVYQGYEVRYSWIITIFSLVTGLHYNIENFVYGFLGAKSKLYATMCLLPLIQTYIMIFISPYSTFFQSHTLLFLGGIGLFLTYANAQLNISSTSKTIYNWLYFDPFFFSAIVYSEY